METESSWENVGQWYSRLVGEKGHRYHQSLIFPGAIRLLQISSRPLSLLDMGCGEGCFSRSLPPSVDYQGIDASPSFIRRARQKSGQNARFFQADVTEALPIKKNDFDCASFILSLQNIESPERAIHEAAGHLKRSGRLLIVLNHPCFRIPRQSEWGIDRGAKLQYRRINRYLSPMKIPIQMRSREGTESITHSFHHPLEDYFRFLTQNNLAVIALEEWTSGKKSTGPMARMEDRARMEFPLFLAVLARYF